MEGATAKGFGHDLVDDRGYSTMRQSTKLATKLATKFLLPNGLAVGQNVKLQEKTMAETG